MREDLEGFVAGYHGHDSMRDKAQRMFRAETRGLDMHVPHSASSKARTKMRFYAEGGEVEPMEPEAQMKRGGHHKRHHSRHHGLSHDQTDLHIPKRAREPKMHRRSFEKAEHMRHGGRSHKKHHYGWGGNVMQSLGNLKDRMFPQGFRGDVEGAYNSVKDYIPSRFQPYARSAANAIKTAAPYVDKAYGFAQKYAPQAQQMISKFSPGMGNAFGQFRSMVGLKKGGKAHHKRHRHMNEGGMLGEDPATYAPTAAKRGGKIHRKHKYADGGSLADTMDQYFKPIANYAPRRLMPLVGRAYNVAREFGPRVKRAYERAQGLYGKAKEYAPMAEKAISALSPSMGESFGRLRSMVGLKKGGKAHGKHHYARGGTVYEHHMVGEHPSHRRPHINYEAEMRGEHCVSGPKNRRVHHRGVDDESHHQNFAMGGVGKIRHMQADKHGKPLHRRMHRVAKGK